MVSATSTAGSTCASLTRSIAAIAAGPAGSGTNIVIGRGIGDQREDRVRIDVGRQFKRDRLVGVDAERARAAAVMTSRGSDRRAKRPECGQPLLVEPFDRQAEQRFAAAGHHHRPAGPEFGQAPANAHLFAGSKKDGTRRSPPAITH